jgi:hypothetical protein
MDSRTDLTDFTDRSVTDRQSDTILSKCVLVSKFFSIVNVYVLMFNVFRFDFCSQ